MEPSSVVRGEPPLGLSPYRYFQERHADDPWAVLSCAVMLNQTSGKQLEPVHTELFDRWPTCYHMAAADVDDVEAVVRPLGLQRRRSRGLIRLAAAYAFMWDGADPASLPSVGRYGSDSYEIFVAGRVPDGVSDKELKRYVAWARSREGVGSG